MTVSSESIPKTATGSSTHRNYDGQVIAITVFSTVRPWRNLALPVPIPGKVFLPVLFEVAARIPPLTRTLRKLSFIHFARWSLIKELPDNGQKQPKLTYTHMYFESNFNGGWEEYIDAFSHILTRGMTTFWGSSFGYPKPLPTSQFKAYIQQNEVEASHYYCAYPEATATMVQDALALADRLERLKKDAARMDPKAFAAAYDRFLTDAQGWM
jgi:hypothetical protein